MPINLPGGIASPAPAPSFNDTYDITKSPLLGGGTYGEGRIADANKRLQALQQALQSGQIDYKTYQQLFQQFDPAALQMGNQIAQSGSKQASAANSAGLGQLQGTSALGGQDLNTFVNQFKNLTGKDPSAQDINNYFSNAAPLLSGGPGGAQGTSYADVNSILNQYLQNTYQPQIKGYQQEQQTDQLNQAQQQSQDLIGQQNQQTINQLTSPQVMEQFKQAYNQNGLLNSGAFSEGLGNTLANAASGNISSALGGITIPGIQNIMGTANQPYQSFLGNMNSNLQSAGQNQNAFQNFNLQKSLAEQLAALQSPSNLQEWAPIISGGLQGAGAAAGGTYLCTHLKNLGLMTEGEVDQVHDKLFPRFIFHPIKVLLYAAIAPGFIKESKDFDWAALKPRICDQIIKEDDSETAFQMYVDVCMEIFGLSVPSEVSNG